MRILKIFLNVLRFFNNSKNFSRGHTVMIKVSWYLKDVFDSGLCNRKKIRNVRHINPILSTEMSDSCVFSTSKIWHPNQTRKFYEIFIFCSKFFFRTSLANFSWVQYGCSRYLEGVFYLQVYVEKRMKVIHHIDQNIFGKN